MALSVPTFTDPMQQVKPDGLPSVRVDTTAPADAFGSGQSQKDLNSAEMNLGKTVTDYAQDQRDKADQVAHVAADTQASQLQTQIQVNVSKMKGQDAFVAPDYAEQAWKEGVDKIRSSLNGRNQQMAFDKSTAERYDTLNKSVQTHVSQQSQEFADQTTQAGLEQAKNNAAINSGDDHQVAQNADLTKQLVDGLAARKGWSQDSEIYKDKLQSELSSLHSVVIQERLSAGLDQPAKEYFEANKDQMTAHDLLKSENALESGEIISKSTDIFNGVQTQKGLRYSDGSVNGEAVRKFTMAQTEGMSDQKQLKVLAQVKAQVAEYNRDRYHQLSANERSFADEVISARQNNMPLNQALTIAQKWGYDAYDMAQKSAFIQSTYAPPAATKAIAHEDLKEGIQAGTVELSDIDRAYNHGDLNAEDWANLRQTKIKTAADGTDPQMKYTDGLIKQMANKAIPKDPEAQAQFQYILNQKSQGKTADEKLAIAQDELKKVVVSPGWLWNTTDNKFKADAQAAQGANTATGQMYQDIGFKQAQAISQGLGGNQFTRDANPAAHIQAFANTLGVKYDDLKVGQPTNNAIRSLQAKGKAVTPETVQKVLQKYPDGNWQ